MIRFFQPGSFLHSFIAFESGIDPLRCDWYRENLSRPVLTYWRVLRPGELRRDFVTGNAVREPVTIKEYFCRIGVGSLCNELSVEALDRAMYQVINPWGFIGCQLGEALLIDTGHYRPRVVEVESPNRASLTYERYYSGECPSSCWAEGRSERVISLASGKAIIGTHTNEWAGSFTGLDGVYSLNDLMKGDVQLLVLKRTMKVNFHRLETALSEKGQSTCEALERINRKRSRQVGRSGLAAAMHLCGVWAVADYLCHSTPAQDETGTTLVSYLDRFGAFPIDEWIDAPPATVALSSGERPASGTE